MPPISSAPRSPRSPTPRGARSSPASRRARPPSTELAEPFPISVQAVSKHLRVLERAGLITRGRAAQLRPSRLRGVALERGGRLARRTIVRFWEDGLRPASTRRLPAMAEQPASTITPRLRRAARAGLARVDRPRALRGLVRRPECEVPLTSVAMDVRPGGTWRLTMFAGPGRHEIHWKGEYREVASPSGWCSRSRTSPARTRVRAGHRRAQRPRRRPHRDALRAARRAPARDVRADAGRLGRLLRPGVRAARRLGRETEPERKQRVVVRVADVDRLLVERPRPASPAACP